MQGFKITEPNVGGADVAGHYGQTDLNGCCYGKPYWLCKVLSICLTLLNKAEDKSRGGVLWKDYKQLEEFISHQIMS